MGLGFLTAFLAAHVYKILLAVVLIALGILVYLNRAQVCLSMRSFWYGLPLIGRVHRLSRKVDTNKAHGGWFSAEQRLCAGFKKDLDAKRGDPEMYDRARNYLTKVGEIGRKQMRWFWLPVFVLMAIEAAGFAVILAGMTVPGTSRLNELWISVLIGIMLACVLLFLTHAAGRNLHHRKLVKKARVLWQHDLAADPHASLVAKTPGVSLENDHVDDGAPAYRQILNRLDHNAEAKAGFPTIPVIAAVLVIAVGVLATLVRMYAFDSDQIRKLALSEQGAQTTETAGSSDGGVGFDAQDLMEDGDSSADAASGASGAPAPLAEQARAAEENRLTSLLEAEEGAAYTTFIALFFVFIAVQVMGVISGYKFGFSGRESDRAHRYVRRHDSRRAYEDEINRWYQKVSAVAQQHLANLQGRMLQRAMREGTAGQQVQDLENSDTRTFEDYVVEMDQVRPPLAQAPGHVRTRALEPSPKKLLQGPGAVLTEERKAELRRQAQKEVEQEFLEQERQRIRAGGGA